MKDLVALLRDSKLSIGGAQATGIATVLLFIIIMTAIIVLPSGFEGVFKTT